MPSNFPPGYVEEDEPGPWFEDLAVAPTDTKCHKCGDVAEWKDDDDELWCSPCAGEHDFEIRTSDPWSETY